VIKLQKNYGGKNFMSWTTQQQNAIDSRNKNLLVAAAAGSGKTAVLVERITKLALEDDFDVDKMLVVTFTNAAAQEMKNRIHKKFLKLMETETDAEKISKLERQSILLSGASITTFHSFCLSVIKQHFSKIDLDPKFREGNEQELEILKQEVIEKLFEDKYAEGDEEFNKFTDNFGGTARGDEEIYKMVLDLYKFSQSRPYPETWLKTVAECYKNPETFKLDNGKTWLEVITNFAENMIENLVEEMYSYSFTAKTQVTEQNISDKNIAKKWQILVEFIDREFNLVSKLKNLAKNWDALCGEIKSKITLDNYPRHSFPDDLSEVKSRVKELRDNYKKNLEDLGKVATLTKSEILAEIKDSAESVQQLVNITLEFEKAFSKAKRDRGIIDFNDMEHLALQIFNTDKRTAKIYRDKFKVIMVDEYQDTNDVQEEIISKIVGDDNFFAVGDVKQSIYRFRNAAPEIFLQKYKTYPTLDNSERIDLSKNFRSRRQVVEAVNAIFRRVMTEDAMEIEYNQDAELNFGAVENYPTAENTFDEKAEFLIVTQDKTETQKNTNSDAEIENNFVEDEENAKKESFGRLEKEIQLIANKINSMFDEKKQVWDGEKKIYRGIEYKDIVILLRATDGKATKIVDILHENNIPAYAEDKGGYFKAKEIQTILNLLNLLDNVRQDIPLAAVMLSPIGGFSAEDLTKMRIDDRNDELFILVNVCAMGNDELGLRCLDFLKKINHWRELSKQVSVPELLTTIYRETGYYDYFDNPAGKISQANLRILIDRAAEFETTAYRGLSRFIQFIKKIRDLGNDLSAARTLGENENVVRVMTIHKSKGLEFPVVFVAELGKQINFKDLSESVIAHRNLGLGICKIVEDNSGVKRIPTFAKKILEKKMRLETLAEELRIFYVAVTRAKEKLILVGTGGTQDAIEKTAEGFGTGKIPTNNLQATNIVMNWLFMIKKTAQEFIDFKFVTEIGVNLSGEKISEVAEEKISAEIEKAENSPLENIPAKLSVTELKRRILAEEDLNISATYKPAQNIYPARKFSL